MITHQHQRRNHHHTASHRRTGRLRDEQLAALIVAIMASAIAFILVENLYRALAMGLAAGILVYAGIFLQSYRKRHDLCQKRNGSRPDGN